MKQAQVSAASATSAAAADLLFGPLAAKFAEEFNFCYKKHCNVKIVGSPEDGIKFRVFVNGEFIGSNSLKEMEDAVQLLTAGRQHSILASKRHH